MGKYVLMIGLDDQLLRTRQAVLISAGIITTSVSDLESVAEALRRDQPAVFLLCHSVVDELREQAIGLVRQNAASTKVLVLLGLNRIPVPPGCYALDAFGPSDLIQAVRNLLEGTPKVAGLFGHFFSTV